MRSPGRTPLLPFVVIRIALSVFVLGSASCQVTDYRLAKVGDRICHEGFVMDNYCIELGTLLDERTSRTLEKPERHSVHCLIDVPPCVGSNFELLAAPAGGSTMYTRAYQLTNDSKQGIIDVASSVGAPQPQGSFACRQCTGTMGSLGRGFRAEVYGVVVAEAQPDGTPATVHIVDAVATHDRVGSSCLVDFPMEQNPIFGEALGTAPLPEQQSAPEEQSTPEEQSAPEQQSAPEEQSVPEEPDAPMGLTDPTTVAVGDNVCFEGFVMDNFCIERGTLLDNSNVRTLIGPDQHSVHCLIDISVCRNSNFELLREPEVGEVMYTRAFQFSGQSKEGIIDIAAAVGDTRGCRVCKAETGMLRQGFRAEVYGVVTEMTEPPTIQIVDAQASNGLENVCMRTSMPDQSPSFGEAESEVGTAGTKNLRNAAEISIMAIAFVAVGALGVISVFGKQLFPQANKEALEPEVAVLEQGKNRNSDVEVVVGASPY